jgi:hypothetical protein
MPPKKNNKKLPVNNKGKDNSAKKAASPVTTEIDFSAGWNVLKEIQKTIAVWAYNSVAGSGSTMKAAEIKSLMFKKYHGTEKDSVGLAEKFYKGVEMFKGIYGEDIDPATGKPMKYLKPILHLRDKTVTRDVPGGITMTALTAKTKRDLTPLAGRTLYDMARGVIAQARLVQAHINKSKKWKDCKTAPSGEQWEDFLKFIRFKMALSGNSDVNAIDVEAKDTEDVQDSEQVDVEAEPVEKDEDSKPAAVPATMNEDEEAEALKDWESSEVFSGYMAFALWGHIPMPGLESYRAIAFQVDDSGSVGRKQLRKVAAKEETKKREAAAISEDRGISRKEAMLAQDVDSRKSLADSRRMQLLQNNFEFKLNGIRWQMEIEQNKMQGPQAYVMENPHLFRTHEESYANDPMYKMYYDGLQELNSLKKRFNDVIAEQGVAFNQLAMQQMPPPAKRQKQMSIDEVSSSAASAPSNVPPVPEVSTNYSTPRPNSRLSNAESTAEAEPSETNHSADDELDDPKHDDELDDPNNITGVVSLNVWSSFSFSSKHWPANLFSLVCYVKVNNKSFPELGHIHLSNKYSSTVISNYVSNKGFFFFLCVFCSIISSTHSAIVKLTNIYLF